MLRGKWLEVLGYLGMRHQRPDKASTRNRYRPSFQLDSRISSPMARNKRELGYDRRPVN